MSKDKSTPVDIVFLNDTTGSMSGATNGITDSVETFSTAITSAGVDARFAMYTYGMLSQQRKLQIQNYRR